MRVNLSRLSSNLLNVPVCVPHVLCCIVYAYEYQIMHTVYIQEYVHTQRMGVDARVITELNKLELVELQ